jgi:hypothetical protein
MATLNEVILTQTDTTMTTSIYNPRNGYTIGMSYTVIDEILYNVFLQEMRKKLC